MLLDTKEKVGDAELAIRATDGDRGAFAELYARHYHSVYGYFRARVLDAAGVDDLSQEVFLRAFDALRRFDPTQPFGGWLKGICRNVLREYVRRIRRRKEVGWTELCLELEKMTPDGPYDNVLQQLPRCMQALSDSASEALRLYYFGGLKVDVVAQRMKRSNGAVKVLLVRARQALKRCLDRQLKEEA